MAGIYIEIFPSGTALKAMIGLTILPLITIILYRLHFHPLSKVPGPRFAAISNLWHAYHVRNGHMLELGKTLHKRYGPMVRVGPNEVWFNSKEAFKRIYSESRKPGFMLLHISAAL
jgi:hypothetical protein